MHLPSFLKRLFPKTIPAQDRFTAAYHANGLRGTESLSGPGSDLPQTAAIRAALPPLLQSLNAKILLDCPSGDFHWMKLIDLPIDLYIGGDVVPELAFQNQKQFGDSTRRFLPLNLLTDTLPAADVLLCRDCLVHLTDTEIRTALANISRSPITYLLTTTFPNTPTNRDLESTRGNNPKWRPINLQLPPYDFPAPQQLINENCTEKNGRFPDKSLALWKISTLPIS